MSSSLKNVIIVGAAGKLGASILATFNADPNFNVSILSRKSSKSVFPAHLVVHRVSDEYPEDELLEALKGQDVVISTISKAAADVQQKAIIDSAIKAGVKRFIPSEFGSDTRNEKAMKIFPFFKLGTSDRMMKNEQTDAQTKQKSQYHSEVRTVKTAIISTRDRETSDTGPLAKVCCICSDQKY
ncbi:hypothetical protein BGAL_0043g00220 [Botrytis galanthina]|uniref:NmrA-like domain-containing protein n=1 Tax=Botrytis galanthina TaxID=278940 RepID=A0A4V4HVL4_9HELO|nr:hypothetical protein BGAL_0043g00220 [Botrytis galanthina]